MLKELQEEMGLTYLFIAHDLSVVKYISDRVIVMYLGTMVEFADSEELYAHPLHPYTQVLLSSIPVADPRLVREKKRIMVKGEIQARSTRRTAAVLPRDVRMRRRSAGRSCRNSGK